MNKVVAIVGMCGSGKSVATELFENSGWKKVYFGGVTLRTLAECGLEVNPDNEKKIRENLRIEYGKQAYAVKLLPIIEQLLAESNVVLDGLYSWTEYKYLCDNLHTDLQVLCIASNRSKRYERLKNRTVRPLTVEEAYQRDVAEIENLEKGGPISIADNYILNNGTMEEFVDKVNDFIKSITQQHEISQNCKANEV